MTARLVLTDDVSWCVESGGIRVFNPQQRTSHFLAYPRAAVWDLISRNTPREKCFRLISLIARCTEDQAHRLVEDAIQEWIRAGLLKRLDHGQHLDPHAV